MPTLFAWIGASPALITLLALWFVPGLVVANVIRVRGLLAWTIAPLVTAGIAALGSVTAPLVGLAWHLPTFALYSGIVIGLAGLLRIALDDDASLELARLSPTARWLTGGAAAALIVPIVFTIKPDDVIQQIDPTFHMNALWLINHTGNASSFGGLTAMYGLQTTATTFPAGWHAVVSLASGITNVVQATNAMAVMVPLLWVFGLASFAQVLFPRRQQLARDMVALIPAVIIFPTFLTTLYPALPNALEISLLPGVISFGLAAVTQSLSIRSRTIYLLITMGFVGAVALIHPSIILALIVLSFLPSLYLFAARWWRGWQNQRRQTIREIVLVSLLLVLAGSALLATPAVRAKLALMATEYHTAAGDFIASVPKALTVWPYITSVAGAGVTRPLAVLQLCIAVVTVVGLISLLPRHRGRMVVLAWTMGMVLTFTTLWRSGPLLWLAGMWYMSPHRTMAIQSIMQLPVMAAGIAWFADLLRRRWKPKHLTSVVAAVALVGTTALSTPARIYLAREVYHPEPSDYTHVASPEELAMIRSLDEVLPPDARVLGDPYNGSALVQAVGNREVVFPQLYFRESNVPEAVLRYQFRIFDSNQAVCNYVHEYGITHLYLDTDTESFGKDNTVEAPGLYGVDTSVGFTKVASGGSASVWRIDVCDSK